MRWILMVAALMACGGEDRHEGLDATPREASVDAGVEMDAGGGDVGTADAGLSQFEEIYSTILVPTCVASGCHDTATAGGGQDFTRGLDSAYETLLGDTVSTIGAPNWPKRVVPGNPDASFFWIKVSRDDAPLGRMPLVGSALTAANLYLIRTWIESGASID